MKTGDDVDLNRRADREVELLPGGRLAAAVKVEAGAVVPVGGKLLCGVPEPV